MDLSSIARRTLGTSIVVIGYISATWNRIMEGGWSSRGRWTSRTPTSLSADFTQEWMRRSLVFYPPHALPDQEQAEEPRKLCGKVDDITDLPCNMGLHPSGYHRHTSKDKQIIIEWHEMPKSVTLRSPRNGG
jgi:hypothetical protein